MLETVNTDIVYKQLSELFIVYLLTDLEDNKPYHVGLCRANELLQIPDARRIPQFDENRRLRLQTLITCKTLGEAKQRQSEMLTMMGGWPKLSKDRLGGVAPKMIYCHETGEYFRTIADVTKKYGGTQSAMSNHLNRKPGFRSVLGKMYSRMPCPDLKLLVRR